MSTGPSAPREKGVNHMAKYSNFLRKCSIGTLDVLAVLAGTILAAPFALVIVSPFLNAF